jgi:hypothetical protein
MKNSSHEQNLKLLESLSEADLDKPTKAPPKGLERRDEPLCNSPSSLTRAQEEEMNRDARLMSGILLITVPTIQYGGYLSVEAV